MFRNFLGYVKLPSAAKKATLAALLFMMFESSSKFIATKLNRPNNLVKGWSNERNISRNIRATLLRQMLY